MNRNAHSSLTRGLAIALAAVGGVAGASLAGAADRVVAQHGTRGADVLRGTSGANRMFGGRGADRLFGGRGDDRLYGGPGNDRLSGGAGNDRLAGGAGNDRLSGGPGRDRIDCGPGRDVARAHRGDRTVGCERVLGLGTQQRQQAGAGPVTDGQASPAETGTGAPVDSNGDVPPDDGHPPPSHDDGQRPPLKPFDLMPPPGQSATQPGGPIQPTQ